MIDFSSCSKSSLEEVVEALAYRVLRHENPTYCGIPEEMVYELLKSESLEVIYERNGAYPF